MTNPDDLIHTYEGQTSANFRGLTKREYFAVMAMQGVEASNNPLDNNDVMTATEIAKRAIRIADALIEALNKEGK